jgi:hypothetical protein
MTKSTLLALALILLPCAALCSPASDQPNRGVAITQGAAVAPKPTIELLRGTVASINQHSDMIEIRLSPDKAEQFRVQDGLVFNSVRYGDQVEITVQNIAGAKTIVGLRKE